MFDTPLPRHRSNFAAWKMYALQDYNVQAPHSPYSGEYIHLLTLGAKASVRF